MRSYRAPLWLPGGQLQTIWPALYARSTQGPVPQFERERWATPDGDFIDVDFLKPRKATQPMLVLFHGLEGSSSSHYAQAFASWAAGNHVQLVIPHFRGCSGELNLAPRAYHSGDHVEIDWILKKLKDRQEQSTLVQTLQPSIVAAGVSLGGNALMRWAGEQGQAATKTVSAVASICSPLDLAASGHAIGQGFNKLVYTRMFLRSMKPKALDKWQQHPGLFDKKRLLAAQDLYEFDNIFTAPLHGFRDTVDYWAQASAKPHLSRIAVPALLLNAQNDPFVPVHSLPTSRDISPHVQLWQPRQGGHVGFATGRPPGHLHSLPQAVGSWLLKHTHHG